MKKFQIQKGLMFYLSPSVRPTYKDMEEMIKSAGGIVLRDVPKLTSFLESFTDEHNSVRNICLLQIKFPIFS